MRKKNNNNGVALVLSSGGARGIAHIGVIEALEAEGYEIHSISGSSMGAVIGGLYAAGCLESFRDWICTLNKMDVFRLMDFTISSQGFLKGNKVFDEMSKFIKDVNIEDLQIPFCAVAANINTNEEVVFSNGSLFHALRASISIPSILTPYEYNDCQLVDGGIVNPIPVKFVDRRPDDLLVVVDVNALTPYSDKKETPNRKIEKNKENDEFTRLAEQLKAKWIEFFPEKPPSPKKLGLIDVMTESLALMQNQLTRLIIEKYQPHMHITISKDTCGTFDFHKSAIIIEEGKKAFHISHDNYLKSYSDGSP